MLNNSKIKDLIRLGFDCNVKCKFCNFIKENEPQYNDFSFDNIKKQIDELAAKNIAYLSFSGGEPLLRTDLEEIISYAIQKGVKDIDIQTNAILLDNKRIINLKKAGLNIAFVSFHTHIPLLYEKLLGQKNIFDKIVNNIRLFIANDIEVILNPVINQLTYKYLASFAEYIITELKGIKSISLSVIQPHGSALKNYRLIPDYSEIDPYIKKFIQQIISQTEINIINPYCGLPMCIGDWYEYPDKNVEYIENFYVYKKNNNKIYLNKCKQCQFYKLCNGVWNNYVNIFGSTRTNTMLKTILK